MRTKRLRGRGWFAAASTLGLLLAVSPAIAQEEWTPRTQGNRLGADVDFLSTYDSTLFSVSFVGQVRLTHHIYLDFDLPWGYSADRFIAPGGRVSDSRFVLGNPTIGVHYAKTLGRHVAFFVGGLITVPTHFRGSKDSNAANEQIVTRAYDDFYRFQAAYVDLTGRIGVEITVRPLFLRFDARPVFMIPVGGDADRVELVVQQSNELELLANMGLGGGIRLQAVFFPTLQGNGPFNQQNDRAQLAFEPFFAYEPPHHGFFARVGVLIGADEPLGFGFDQDKVATVRATLGGKW